MEIFFLATGRGLWHIFYRWPQMLFIAGGQQRDQFNICIVAVLDHERRWLSGAPEFTAEVRLAKTLPSTTTRQIKSAGYAYRHY